MIIFPAIDLKGGKCVRLFKGDMNQATIFNENPISQAQDFANCGFLNLHIVDLDGAIAGKSINFLVVKNIVENVKINVQLGGGIRTLEDIDRWFEIGVSRVILGTIAVQNPDLVFQACQKYPKKIIVGIDAKNSQVATHGWVKSSNYSVIELAKKFNDCQLSAIIYTDIARDGTLSGFDLHGTAELASNIKIPVIASGGISSVSDLVAVKNLEDKGVVGAIVGRAWYENKISLLDLKKANLL